MNKSALRIEDVSKNMAFGLYLRRLRNSKKLSQRALASLSGVSSPYIAQIEKGQRPPPSQRVLNAFAAALQEPYKSIWHAAGYAEPEDSFYENDELERAFAFVLGDKRLTFGNHIDPEAVAPDIKRFVVQMY